MAEYLTIESADSVECCSHINIVLCLLGLEQNIGVYQCCWCWYFVLYSVFSCSKYERRIIMTRISSSCYIIIELRKSSFPDMFSKNMMNVKVPNWEVSLKVTILSLLNSPRTLKHDEWLIKWHIKDRFYCYENIKNISIFYYKLILYHKNIISLLSPFWHFKGNKYFHNQVD